MRVRTEDKRQEIIEIAAQLFEDLGYDRTSMSLISERVGGSKATLYGYFKSKEELLLAVPRLSTSAPNSERLMDTIASRPELPRGPGPLGVAYMDRRLAPRPISNVRIVSTQPEELGIGKNSTTTSWSRPGRNSPTARQADGGRHLEACRPWMVAMQWKGLLEWTCSTSRLMGAIREGDPREIREAAMQAADIILKVYGNEGAGDMYVPDVLASADEQARLAAIAAGARKKRKAA